MKTIHIILIFFISINLAFSQTMFKSFNEIGVKPYMPTKELKEKVAKISGKAIRTEAGEFDSFEDKDFYQLSNGFVSLYQDVEYAYLRIIFDKNHNWIETHQLFHSDVQKEDVYYQIMPKMEKETKKKGYKIKGWYYIKITNEKGFWYEVKASKKKDTKVFIFDKDLKLVGTKKVE